MKTFAETTLSTFNYWSGAVNHAYSLTIDELDELDNILTDLYPNGISETMLNDIMWFDFDWVCETLGLRYDNDNDKVIRD